MALARALVRRGAGAASAASALPVLAFVAAFALAPVALLFAATIAAAGGPAGVGSILAQPANLRSIDNSLAQASISAVLAVAFGYPAGVFLGRYQWPGRSAVRSFLLVPFLLPSLVVVFGVTDLFGSAGLLTGAWPGLAVFGRGVPGIVAVNLLFNVPIVILLTAAGVEGSAIDLEETVATLGGSPGRAYLDAWAGPSWVGAIAGGLLTFLFSALSFAPPLLLCGPGCYTVEAQVWFLDTYGLAPTSAGVLAAAMVALFALPTFGYLWLLGRIRSRPGRRATTPRRPDWRHPAVLGMAIETAAVLGAVLALLGAVLVRTLSPVGGGGFGSAWSALLSPSTSAELGISIGGAVDNTLFFATLAAAIALLLGILAAFATARRPRFSRALGLVLFVPLLVSPIVLAFALAEFWRPLLGGESMVWALVVVSQAILALPLAIQSLGLPLASLGGEVADAARTLGASRWGAFLDADLPRVRDGLLTASMFAFALGLGEFTATYFLVTPRFTTLPVALYDLANTRLVGVADGAAGLLLLLSLAVFGVIAIGGRRVEL